MTVLRTLVGAMVVLLAISLLPPTVPASTAPVDLLIGGEGSMRWAIGPIAPGDNGAEKVEVRNAGSSTGYLRMWVSGIEATDHGGDGPALERYLRFAVTADGLSTAVTMPASIGRLPSSPSGPDEITVGPLPPGKASTITWSWEFEETGTPQNDAQGDGLSFDLHYMLTDAPPGSSARFLAIDLLGWQTAAEVDRLGTVQHDIDAVDPLGINHLVISSGTVLADSRGEAPGQVVLSYATMSQVPGPAGTVQLGPMYRLDGYSPDELPVKFISSAPMSLTLGVNASDLPAGYLPMGVFRLDGERWVRLPAPAEAPDRWSVEAQVNSSGYLAVFAAPVREGEGHLYATSLLLTTEVERRGWPIVLSMKQGQTMYLTTDATNPGRTSGIFIVDLVLDGQVVDSVTVMLEPGESVPLSFEVGGLENGHHEVTLLEQTVSFDTMSYSNWAPLVALNGAWWAILVVVGRRDLGALLRRGRPPSHHPMPPQPPKTHLQELAEKTEIANPQLMGDLDDRWGHREGPPGPGDPGDNT